MLSRRDLFSAGLAGGLSAGASGAAEPAQQGEPTREGQREIARALDQVQDALERGLLSNSLSYGIVGKLRALMEQFLRSHGKFPDYFEVGPGVFIEMYDWHVRNRQQLVVTRLADGRYTMQFMFSTLLLRAEQESGYIGYPYDKG